MIRALAIHPQEAHPKLWAGALILCVLLNILWYTAKLVLRAHEYPVSFIWHSNDFTNLLRLVLNERDVPHHRWHIALLISCSVVFVAFIGSAIMFFLAVTRHS